MNTKKTEAGGNAVLDNAGQISAEFAKQFAESEFEKYRIIRKHPIKDPL